MAQRKDLLLYGDPVPNDYVEAGSQRPLETLGPIKRVNLLLGANSSGKSRLLRDLARRPRYILASPEEAQRVARMLSLGELLAEWTGFVGTLDAHTNSSEAKTHRSNVQAAASGLRTSLGPVPSKDLATNRQHLNLVERVADALVTRGKYRFTPGTRVGDEVKMLALFNGATELFESFVAKPPSHRVLIPTLRTAHTIQQFGGDPNDGGRGAQGRIHEDVFASTFTRRYGAALNLGQHRQHTWRLRPNGERPPLEIWTGATLFECLLALQNARREMRSRKEAFDRFIGSHFFPNVDLEFVAALGQMDSGHTAAFDGQIHVVIGREDRELHEIGDGIAALALLLFPIFTAERGSWIFIEEPEHHLHPGYQRILVEALLDNPSIAELDLTIVITTHSNHLLDVAMERGEDVSVTALSRESASDEALDNVARRILVRPSGGRDVQLLDALGVRNGSVYLANCSIWVEGPSEIIYLRALIAAHPQTKGFQEDLHYSFITYGGSLLAHFEFETDDFTERDAKLNLASIANRTLVLADRDVKKAKKHDAWRKRADAAGAALQYLQTPGREIENLLTARMLALVVARRLRVPTESDEALKTILERIGNGPSSMTSMGPFLKKAFADDQQFEARVAAWTPEKTGCLSANVKLGFARAYAEFIRSEPAETRDALIGSAALKLADELVAFIKRHNR